MAMRLLKTVECTKAFMEVFFMQQAMLDQDAVADINKIMMLEITETKDYIYVPEPKNKKFFIGISAACLIYLQDSSRIKRTGNYFSLYPWRWRISKEEHLLNGSILITSEVYTFQERVVRYLEEAAHYENI